MVKRLKLCLLQLPKQQQLLKEFPLLLCIKSEQFKATEVKSDYEFKEYCKVHGLKARGCDLFMGVQAGKKPKTDKKDVLIDVILMQV